MSRVFGRSAWLAVACLVLFAGFMATLAASSAKAEDTVWICKPGQSDDLCAGTIEGKSWKAGEAGPTEPLTYTRPADPPIDCFYLYPTQSAQETPNSNLDKDPPIRRVVVQQARMFSSVCKVYAPMYRQVTNGGNQTAYNPVVETAYQSAKAGFEDYLKNYNHGRGFIMIGHSQGSAHTARLIDELVDTDAALRKRFVGAIAPGANISVAKNQNIGGLYQNVPACSEVGQYGCLIAYSTFKGQPADNSLFARLDFGYWIYTEPRPDPNQFEVVCTDPSRLDGSGGKVLPLVNLDYVSGVPEQESVAPWVSFPDYYTATCDRAGTAHWLNIARVNDADTRPDLGALVASGNNYHVPEVNLFEGNLLTIAGKWSDAYTAAVAHAKALSDQLATLVTERDSLKKRLAAKSKALKKTQKAAKKLARKASKAKGKRKKGLKRTLRKKNRAAKAQLRQVKSLQKQVAAKESQIADVEEQISQLG